MSFFFVSSSFATTTPPEINVDYLNELTGPKVTWETATESDSDIVLINGAYYKYTYHKPDDYTETNTRLEGYLDENDINKVVFKGIAYKSNESYGGAIYNTSNEGSSITSDFLGNSVLTSNYSDSTRGGAIYNNGNIGDIVGDFISNTAEDLKMRFSKGGAVYNKETIGTISGKFISNIADYGGAIYNSYKIDNILGIFIGNNSRFTGGAIYNSGYIKNIAGQFISNSSTTYHYSEKLGGVLLNKGTIDNITGDFINNYKLKATDGNPADLGIGAAIDNRSTIKNITANFINNYVEAKKNSNGGAINNTGSISLTNSNFLNNYAQTELTDKSNAQGGAIYNTGTLNISANDSKQSIFSGNKIIYKNSSGNYVEESNAIHMAGGTLNLNSTNEGLIQFNDGISGSNYTINVDGDDTGRIELNNEVSGLSSMDITGSNVYFGENSKTTYTINTTGGSINNAQIDDGGVLNVSEEAVANNTTVNSGGKLETAENSKINGLLANGGALIDLDAGTVLTGDVHFDVNATLNGGFDYSKIFDEIVQETGSLTLEGGINTALSQDSLINTAEDKSLVLSNGNFEVGSGVQEISGWKELNVTDNATVKLAGDIALAETQHKVNLLSGSTLDLAGNSPLIATINGSVNNDGDMTFSHATDGADDHITIKGNYTAFKNASMTIDVDVANNTADILTIEGDVVGRTRVVINPINDNGGTATMTDKALFVEAPNDDTSTGAYFDVYRMVADARVWNSYYENNKWYVGTSNVIANSQSGYGTTDDDKELILGETDNTESGGNTINITTGKPQVVSEAIAYMSLPRIGLEQTKDLMRVVSNKVASSKIKSGRCGMGECNYDGQAVNGAWIDLGHKKSEIDAPVAVEAKINAIDLGFDIQKDLHNRLGIFASYRQGEYELSGDGEDYYSKVGADIDIDSWILGLYHRYDYGRLWTMSSIYGGIQRVDMHTDDGVSSDTDGIQFGGSVEAGLVFEPQKRLTIEPSIRLGYNFIKYDDMSDAYGKTAEFDNVQNIEAEAGVKVEKTFFHNNRRVISKIYIKPSVIQNFGKGDVNITSLDTVEGLENETLIRGEIGGSFNFGNGWSGFGSLGYTYGSDYNATDFNLGVNYNW